MTEVRRDGVHLHSSAPTSLDYVFWPVLLIDQQHVVTASPSAVVLFGSDPSGLSLVEIMAHAPFELVDLLRMATSMVDPHASVLSNGVLRCQSGELLSVELEVQPVVHRPGCVLIWIYPITRVARRRQLLSVANRLALQLLAAHQRRDLYQLTLQALHDLGIVGSIAFIQPDGLLLQSAFPANSLQPFDLPPLYMQTQAVLIEQLRARSEPTLLSQITTGQPPIVIEPTPLPPIIVHWMTHTQPASLGEPLNQLDWALPLMVASLGCEGRNEQVLVLCSPGLCSEDAPCVAVFANYLIAALQQIVLREQMEAQIGRLELIIRHVPDTLLVVRSDMTMTLLNEKPLRAAGYQRDDVEGRPITDIVLPHIREQVIRAWEAARSGETQRFELELLRHDGTTMVCAVTAGRIPGSDEVLAIITDMTVRQQLFQAEKMAALGRLVAGVAHELNNPMAVILGLVQLNLLDTLPSQLISDLRNVEQATLRASRIVQQLTTFVQPHGTRLLPINLVQVIPDIAEKFRMQAIDHGVQVVVDVHMDTPQIDGDVFQIQQVLMNLLSNALQAVERQPEGQLRLIRLHGWGEGQRVRILVGDTGKGVAPELLSRIFEPFFTTRAVGQGVGLGLAIAYAIIQQHNGQIWAENDLISGTMFHISLPASSIGEYANE